MANPEGDLPIVINGAMATVVAGFCLMNWALYVGLPMDVMRSSTTIAVVSRPFSPLYCLSKTCFEAASTELTLILLQEFARHTLGSWGGVLFSIVVSMSAMGALNANVFATAKLCVSASHRNYFPPVLAN
jgi:solute carrier family 7 (L-type amino acid transporter), member 6